MQLLRRSLAVLATCAAYLAVAALPASAAPALVNAGFETGNTTGWNGNGAAAQSYAGFSAASGSYFGLVRSPGCPGEMLEQQFTASDGDTLTGWAFFATGDYLPYDDDGDVRVVIEKTGTDAVVFSSSVDDVGDAGSTPWTRFSYEFQTTGSYGIAVHVENDVDCGTESAVGLDMVQSAQDDDVDGVSDEADNCPGVDNPDQANHDGDAQGDACDADDDNDGFDDEADNCPMKANSAQADADGDGHGDACEVDDDDDGVLDGADNCPVKANSDQVDTDGDGMGDVCDADDDNDTVADDADNCHFDANADQADNDADAKGDVCDADDDNDTVDDAADNCDLVANTTQADNDADRHGDACDLDDDNDGVADARDNCPMIANPDQSDDDHDGIGNACDDGFDSNVGKATGGGWVRQDGDKLSFSVSAKSKRGELEGACTITFRRTKIKCLKLDGYYAAEDYVVLVGDANVNGSVTGYRIVLRDHDGDRFRVTTESGFTAGGAINGGEIKIH